MKKPTQFTALNKINLEIAPIDFQYLTYIEQFLIAKVQPVMHVHTM